MFFSDLYLCRTYMSNKMIGNDIIFKWLKAKKNLMICQEYDELIGSAIIIK